MNVAAYSDSESLDELPGRAAEVVCDTVIFHRWCGDCHKQNKSCNINRLISEHSLKR